MGYFRIESQFTIRTVYTRFHVRMLPIEQTVASYLLVGWVSRLAIWLGILIEGSGLTVKAMSDHLAAFPVGKEYGAAGQAQGHIMAVLQS